MSEERFETWLKENAADYHRPPADVPRDEMWANITTARQVRPVRSSLFQYAIAASLLIGAGVSLGYWMRGPVSTTPTVVASTTSATDSAVRSTIYEVASVQHLTAVEAMLTSFRADEKSETVALQRWARDLLSSTRLLMDSPAGEDPSRRQLLEDLEYVLAQIVQLDPKAPAEDRAIVDRAINREQVLTRIRTSIPAGFSSGS